MSDYMIDVIVPTIPERAESLDRLERSLARTTRRLNIVPLPAKTCGEGWKDGLEITSSPYVLLACDDQEFINPRWADVCIETIKEGDIPCPRVWQPDGRVESQGGDMDVLHHVSNTPKKDGTRVDYTTIPFLSREWAETIGMIDAHYCTDVWVSYRGRQLGIETVLRHGFDVRHHKEAAGRGAGYSQSERDAMDEATMRKELEKCASSSRVH